MSSDRFIPRARPTTYKGVDMRSRLEAGFAAWLDEWSLPWTYEPKAFASEIGQYLPDFRIDGLRCSWKNWEPRTAYLEVKPASFGDAGDEFEVLMRSMAIIWQSEPDAILLLAQPGDGAEKWAECGMLNPKLSPTRDAAFPWAQTVVWVRGPDGVVGLGAPLLRHRGPWATEYWRVRP